MMTRRSVLTIPTIALGTAMINRGRFRLFAQSNSEYSTFTVDLVRRSIVIDMLGLLTLDFKKLSAWQSSPGRFHQTDFQRLLNSGISVFHPAVAYNAGDIYAAPLKDINAWNTFISAHESYFMRVDHAADLERVKASGKIGILIGQQNSHHFRCVADVDLFYKLGQRVSQLTYHRNRIGSGSSDQRDYGLSAYGLEIIDRMNQVGMAVDISHCGDRTTLEALDASKRPVLVTHSNCRALVPGRGRCKTDEAIKRLAVSGGVMGITMIPGFVTSGGVATIEHVLDHVDHLTTLVGMEHAGIGSDVDLDGRNGNRNGNSNLAGIQYERKIYDLTEGLVRRRYTARNIELILGGNFKRALSEIWAV